MLIFLSNLLCSRCKKEGGDREALGNASQNSSDVERELAFSPYVAVSLERGVGAVEGFHLFPVLEDEEGGDGADAELLGEVGDVVGVELGEDVLVARVFVGVLDEEGGYGLAGAAPGGCGLEGDEGLRADEVVELGLGGDVYDDHCG